MWLEPLPHDRRWYCSTRACERRPSSTSSGVRFAPLIAADPRWNSSSRSACGLASTTAPWPRPTSSFALLTAWHLRRGSQAVALPLRTCKRLWRNSPRCARAVRTHTCAYVRVWQACRRFNDHRPLSRLWRTRWLLVAAVVCCDRLKSGRRVKRAASSNRRTYWSRPSDAHNLLACPRALAHLCCLRLILRLFRRVRSRVRILARTLPSVYFDLIGVRALTPPSRSGVCRTSSFGCAASRSPDDSPAVGRVCSQCHGRGSRYRRITSTSATRALKQVSPPTTLIACLACRRTSRKKT